MPYVSCTKKCQFNNGVNVCLRDRIELNESGKCVTPGFIVTGTNCQHRISCLAENMETDAGRLNICNECRKAGKHLFKGCECE